MFTLSKRILACVFALGLCAFAAGCGGNTAKPEANAAMQKVMNAPSKADFAPVGEIKEGRKTVYALVKKTTGSYWGEVIKGMTDAAKENNVNLYVGGVFKDGNWEMQKNMLKELRDKKHDAVILAPTDSAKMASVCKVIYSEKKNLFLVDTGVDGKNYAACYKSNNLDAGNKAALKLLDLMKANGVKETDKVKVVVALNSMGGAVDDRLASATAAWNEKAPKTWTLSSKYLVNYDDKDMARKLISEAVKKDSSIKGVLTLNNGSTGTAVSELMKANRKDVALVGFDMSEDTAKGLADKSYKFATIMQNQYKMGFEAVKAAAEASNKGTLPTVKDVDTGIRIADNNSYKG